MYGASDLLNELIAAGTAGLLLALRTFDPKRSVRFPVYAAYVIRLEILNWLIRTWDHMTQSSDALCVRTYRKLRRERARFCVLTHDDVLWLGKSSVGLRL